MWRRNGKTEAEKFQAAFDAQHRSAAPTAFDLDIRRFMVAALLGLAVAFALDLSWAWLAGMPIVAGVLCVVVDWPLIAVFLFGTDYPSDDEDDDDRQKRYRP